MHTKAVAKNMQVIISACACAQLGVQQNMYTLWKLANKKWKLNKSGSWMEVEVGWKWKLDGSES